MSDQTISSFCCGGILLHKPVMKPASPCLKGPVSIGHINNLYTLR